MSFCGICGGPLGSVTHVCPAMLPAANPWRPWDSPLFLQSPPGAQTWRETWDAEISRLTPEILRDPVAYRLAHVAQLAFDEYEARIKAMGDPAE